MTKEMIERLISAQSDRDEAIEEIRSQLELRLGDRTVVVEELNGLEVSYRVGTACRCSNSCCWYEYGIASVKEIFSEKRIALMPEEDQDD